VTTLHLLIYRTFSSYLTT